MSVNPTVEPDEEAAVPPSTGGRLGAVMRSASGGAGRRAVLTTAMLLGGVALIKLVSAQLDSQGVIMASTPLPVIVLGAIIGLTYGLLAVGLVLIYRTNRIINFAHGQIGAFGAAVFGLAATKWGIPYWLAFPAALGVAAGTAAVAEIGVVRRLRNAPRLMSIVATLGVGQFLVLLGALVNVSASAGSTYPQPTFLPVWEIGGLRVTQAYNGMLILSPLVVVGLAVFLRRSRSGLAIRAAADNPEAARMAGMFASRMSTLAWAIAGALSAFTAILTAPTQGFQSGDSFGPALLLRALTAAVLARMESLPKAMAAGVGLGVLEQVLLWNYPRSGLVEVALFALILVVLLLQRDRSGRDEEKGSWAAVQALRPLPPVFQEIWIVRNLGRIVALAFLAALAMLPLFISNSLAVSFTAILALSIVGLSVGLLSGLGGQVTLGQFAVAAVGAVISYKVSSRIGYFPVALLYAGVAAGVTSVLVGLPSLRIRGLMLSVTTLSFALATPAWLLAQPWMLGDGRDPGRPIVNGNPLDTGHSYYYFALVVFALVLLLVGNVRRSGFGRLLVAVRDNEDNARAFAVPTKLIKIQGYFIAGFVAGIGGATYGHSLSSIGVSAFPTSLSIDVVVMTVLGGIGLMAGPIVGAFFVIGLPLLSIPNIALAATKLGALVIILQNPSGLLQFAEPLRDRVVDALARRRGIDVAAARRDDPQGSVLPAVARPATLSQTHSALQGNGAIARPRTMGPLLSAQHLRRSFGGVVAVADVSLDVACGETLGLIGPNGAGKTTTFELLSGFTRAEQGAVNFQGRDITHASPESRAKLGLIRSFQDAALFPTMTVKESVMTSLERVQPTLLLSAAAGVRRWERRKEERARELVSLMGLDRYRDRQIQELSTGTRRITEIACLIALEPVALLLDEPSSGIAQRETEALGALLVDLKTRLDLTLIIIEHDIPLIMGISDRIIAMADGRVIAEGTPEHVRNHPRVVEAYLGGSIAAIERSGATSPASTPPQRGPGNGFGPPGSAEELLLKVPGLGPARRERVLTTFGSVDALRRADMATIAAVHGVGPGLARRIRASLDDQTEALT